MRVQLESRLLKIIVPKLLGEFGEKTQISIE
jgi:hypothetical protein